ncbi:MAG: hypothetical protein R3C05_12275 [Pirellulaceae bacterium]
MLGFPEYRNNSTSDASTASDNDYRCDGNNILLAGLGSDRVTAGEETTSSRGTKFLLTLSGGQVVAMQSIQPADGGNDTISFGGGNNVVIMGNGADTISVADDAIDSTGRMW